MRARRRRRAPFAWLAHACLVLSGCMHAVRSFDGVDYTWIDRASSVEIGVVVEDWSSDGEVTRITRYELTRRGDDFVGQASLSGDSGGAPIVTAVRVPAAQLTSLLERIATVRSSEETESVECWTYPHEPSWSVVVRGQTEAGAGVELRVRGIEWWWHRGDRRHGESVALDATEMRAITSELAPLLGVHLTGSP